MNPTEYDSYFHLTTEAESAFFLNYVRDREEGQCTCHFNGTVLYFREMYGWNIVEIAEYPD
jgi:hypothetical protein